MLIVQGLGFNYDFQSGSGLPPDFPTALTSSATMWFDASTYQSGSGQWVDRLSSYALDVSNLQWTGSSNGQFLFDQTSTSIATPIAGFSPRSASMGTVVVTHKTSNSSSGSLTGTGYDPDDYKGCIIHFGSGSSNVALTRRSVTITSPGPGELKNMPKWEWIQIGTGSTSEVQQLSTQQPRVPTYWPANGYITPATHLISAIAYSGSGAQGNAYWSYYGGGTNPDWVEPGTGNIDFIGVPSGSFLHLGGAVNQSTGQIETGSGVITGQFSGSVDNVLYFDRNLEKSELNTLRDYLLG